MEMLSFRTPIQKCKDISQYSFLFFLIYFKILISNGKPEEEVEKRPPHNDSNFIKSSIHINQILSSPKTTTSPTCFFCFLSLPSVIAEGNYCSIELLAVKRTPPKHFAEVDEFITIPATLIYFIYIFRIPSPILIYTITGNLKKTEIKFFFSYIF